MTIDSVDGDFTDSFSLSEWLESEKAGEMQRHLEEKIVQMLFNQNHSSNAFQKIITQLAWLGSQPEKKPFLSREIIALNNLVEHCGWLKDGWKDVSKASQKVGSFIADHATEIALGIAICATGVGLAYVTGYALSASVGGVVVAGTGSIFLSEEKSNPHIPPIPLIDPRACSKEELAALQFPLPNTLPKIELPTSVQELLVTADGIWANGQFFSTGTLLKHSILSPLKKEDERGSFSIGYQESDWKRFAYYTYLTEQLEQETDISYQGRGETALALGDYQQAVQNFDKAIEANSANPTFFLEQGAAFFGLGEYDASLENYKQFQVRTPYPFSLSDFALGFAKGLPKGTYESGKGLLLFFTDFIGHPIQTSKQVFDALTVLVNLVHNDEWKIIAEILAPEIHQLVTQWDILSADKKGELAGYALGKHGADILAPGALAKVANKSLKSAHELVATCKNLQIAQETLLLETAAGMGSSMKIAEVVEAGQKTALFAEELGFSAKEMGQLKQAGKLEATIKKSYEHLNASMQESFQLYKEAQKALKPYVKKSMPESKVRELIHATGIPTFPRPKGIPENYIVSISENGAGMRYIDPKNNRTSVRVMPGKPHSPNPSQQKPYVIHQVNGCALDKNGNFASLDTPEAHIPIEEFIYRE